MSTTPPPTTLTWTSSTPASGVTYDWNTASNWSAGGPPNSTTDVQINAGSTAAYTIDVGTGGLQSAAFDVVISDPNVTVQDANGSNGILISDNLLMNAGTLSLDAASFQVGAGTGSGGTITLNSGAVIIGDGLAGANGGIFTFSPNGADSGSLVFNGGTVIAAVGASRGAELDVFATVVGTANFQIDSGATLALLDSVVGNTSSVTFVGGASAKGVLLNDAGVTPAGSFPGGLFINVGSMDVGTGTTQLDSIAIANDAAATASFSGTTLVVTGTVAANGTVPATAYTDYFNLGAGFGAGIDTIGTNTTTTVYDPATGGSVAAAAFYLDSAVCFKSGTHILTLDGNRPVEALQAGDMVIVRRDGRDAPEAVKWVGHSKVDLRRHAHPELAAPIRIKTGALADGLPARDLLVSPEHCMIVDGHCVPAKLLVNGTTIAREYPQAPFIYHHVELERHGILLAEGAEAESYLDTGNRNWFDNGNEPRLLHPAFEVNADAARWQTEACAPLASTPEAVAPIWSKLADRAIALGFELPKVEAVADPDLHLLVDGRRMEPVSDRDARFVFAVPAGAKSVTLASRSSILADRMDPMVRDTRRIGIRVLWAAIRSGDNETILPGDHPALRQGWHQVDTHGSAPWRWTNGAATIPWEEVSGAAMLTVHCYASGWYPVEQDAVLAA